jgi:hypothetical protein
MKLDKSIKLLEDIISVAEYEDYLKRKDDLVAANAGESFVVFHLKQLKSQLLESNKDTE